MSYSRMPEIDQLYEDVLYYRNSENFRDLLQFIRKFRNIAPYNAMLLHIQKPGSTYVASAREWRERFDRQIIPGARPLLMLRPFGPVMFVYEYNDTMGKPLPDELVNPFHTNTTVGVALLHAIERNLTAEGIGIYKQSYGTESAGLINWHPEPYILHLEEPRKVYSVVSYHDIIVNSNLDVTEQVATILHELGHLYCGHVYHDPKIEKWLPERHNIGLTKQEKEFEAETVCWLVCERLGIDNPSAEYLSGYLDNHQQIPEVSIDCILKAASIVESFATGLRPRRKELVIETIDKQ